MVFTSVSIKTTEQMRHIQLLVLLPLRTEVDTNKCIWLARNQSDSDICPYPYHTKRTAFTIYYLLKPQFEEVYQGLHKHRLRRYHVEYFPVVGGIKLAAYTTAYLCTIPIKSNFVTLGAKLCFSSIDGTDSIIIDHFFVQVHYDNRHNNITIYNDITTSILMHTLI